MSDSKLFTFLKSYIAENYENTTEPQIEATARGVEYYLTSLLIPETLAGNKEDDEEPASKVTDYEKHEALAKYLGVTPEEIKPWSDDSFTVNDSDTFDYQLSLLPSDYGTFQGMAGKYYVNKS